MGSACQVKPRRRPQLLRNDEKYLAWRVYWEGILSCQCVSGTGSVGPFLEWSLRRAGFIRKIREKLRCHVSSVSSATECGGLFLFVPVRSWHQLLYVFLTHAWLCTMGMKIAQVCPQMPFEPLRSAVVMVGMPRSGSIWLLPVAQSWEHGLWLKSSN